MSDTSPKLKTVFLWAGRSSYSTEVTTRGSIGRGTFKVTSRCTGFLAGRTAACLSLLPTGSASSCRVSIHCGISSDTFPQSSSGPQRGSKRADGIVGSLDPPLAHRRANSQGCGRRGRRLGLQREEPSAIFVQCVLLIRESSVSPRRLHCPTFPSGKPVCTVLRSHNSPGIEEYSLILA